MAVTNTGFALTLAKDNPMPDEEVVQLLTSSAELRRLMLKPPLVTSSGAYEP